MTGKYGKRAQIKEYNTKDITTGVIKENQDDALYNLRTIKINGKEWYVPVVENTSLNDPNALPFYMMEVERTIKIITPDGEIRLRNENGFYKPIKIIKTDYEVRKTNLEPPLTESTGKASAIGAGKTNP